MATYTYSDVFSIAGVGQNGAPVSAYKASRFSSPPALNATPPGGGTDATATTGDPAGCDGAFSIALPTSEDYYISVVSGVNTYWKGPVSQLYADGVAQGGVAPAGTLPPFRSGFDVTGTLDSPVLASTVNVQGIVQTGAWQNQARRGGNIGAATAGDTPTLFPYGQIEVVIGDSIAAAAGTSNGGFGSKDWASILANNENRLLGLPDAGIGFVDAGPAPSSPYFLPAFSAIGANLVAVTGLGPEAALGLTAVQFGAGTFASSTAAGAANSLTDNRVFNRFIVLYKPIANADGIGVSIQGQNGATFATIDATVTALTAGTATQTPHGNSTVAYWDSGVIASPTVAPTVSFYRSSTHPTGSGGANPTIYGVIYYAPGVAGNEGVLMVNLGASATGTQDWLSDRNWESLLAAFGTSIRRVHIRLGGNDVILARSVTDAAFNNSTTLTSATAAFSLTDVGRPVTGNANIPANTVISAFVNATTVTLSNATTGGSLTAQSVTFGQMPIATTSANLTTIIQRIQAQVPLAEVALFSEYHPFRGASQNIAGWLSPGQWASTIVPMFQSVALNNGCTYVDMFTRFGSIASVNITDASYSNSGPTLTSTSQAQFSQLDKGAIVTGTNIPAGTKILSVQSPTSCTLSATPSGSGTACTINHDVYGLTIDNLHFGDSTNSTGGVDGQRAHAEEVAERMGYAKNLPKAQPGIVTLTTGTNWLCPTTGLYLVTCVGGGGQGGGGGSIATAAAQQGGGGGAMGATCSALLSLTGGTLYPYVIGAGGSGGGAGGALGGHPGVVGANGGSTSFGTGPLVLAPGGGGGGAGNASTNATVVNFAMAGSAGSQYTGGFTLTTTAAPAAPGTGGGFVTAGLNLATSGIGIGGGGCGGSSNTANGGGGGAAGSLTAIATFGVAGASGTSAGVNGVAAVTPNYGCGGGGGGGGTNNTGAGGTGGNGFQGVIYIQKVG